jgi:hypothetical protein
MPQPQSPRYRQLWRRKELLYKALYDFTYGQCGFCVQSGCACKDRICQHVEEQAGKRGYKFEHTGHQLRFIGVKGCVIPPHLRETCTIYLCEKAQKKSEFDQARYAKLKRLCSLVDWQMMEMEDSICIASAVRKL